MKIKTRFVTGYVLGFVQPCLIAEFDMAWPRDWPLVDALFDSVSGDMPDVGKASTGGALDEGSLQTFSGGRFALLVDELNRRCGDLRFSPIVQMACPGGDDSFYLRIAFPTLSPKLVRENLRALIEFLNQGLSCLERDGWSSLVTCQAARCRVFLPVGTNAGNFLSAAVTAGIPFHLFSPQHIVFGYGAGSFVLNSSVSDEETAIGLELASNKHWTNRFLKLAGQPVTRQEVVTSRAQAIKAAESIGYPVVLKPARAEKGLGVFADISGEDDLLHAFSMAPDKYGELLIEEFVPGRLFRINTFRNSVVRVVERRPAVVVGTGKANISELIKGLNAERDRGGPSSTEYPVMVDEDVHKTLACQGLTLDSVPHRGDRVTLTSLSRVNNGGAGCEVMGDFHPDNLSMCLDVARTLRLQLSGIDFLSPDPACPWYENGAKICEVNAKPQLGVSNPEVYETVLGSLRREFPVVRLLISESEAEVAPPVFNVTLDIIEIKMRPATLLEKGCPTQYFSEIIYDASVSQADKTALNSLLVSVEPGGCPV